MLSILPRHIAARVREDIRKQVCHHEENTVPRSKKPFK